MFNMRLKLIYVMQTLKKKINKSWKIEVTIFKNSSIELDVLLRGLIIFGEPFFF